MQKREAWKMWRYKSLYLKFEIESKTLYRKVLQCCIHKLLNLICWIRLGTFKYIVRTLAHIPVWWTWNFEIKLWNSQKVVYSKLVIVSYDALCSHNFHPSINKHFGYHFFIEKGAHGKWSSRRCNRFIWSDSIDIGCFWWLFGSCWGEVLTVIGMREPVKSLNFSPHMSVFV